MEGTRIQVTKGEAMSAKIRNPFLTSNWMDREQCNYPDYIREKVDEIAPILKRIVDASDRIFFDTHEVADRICEELPSFKNVEYRRRYSIVMLTFLHFRNPRFKPWGGRNKLHIVARQKGRRTR